PHSQYHPRQRMGSGSPLSTQSVPSASADGIRMPAQHTVSTIRVSGWDQVARPHSQYHPPPQMGSGSPLSTTSVPSASAEGSRMPARRTVSTIRVSQWDQEARPAHSQYHPRQPMGSGCPSSAQSVPSASADGIRRPVQHTVSTIRVSQWDQEARPAHSQYHPRQRMGSGCLPSTQSVPSASADGIRMPVQHTVSTIRVSGWDQDARPVHSQYHPRQPMGSGSPDQCTVTFLSDGDYPVLHLA